MWNTEYQFSSAASSGLVVSVFGRSFTQLVSVDGEIVFTVVIDFVDCLDYVFSVFGGSDCHVS